MCEDKTIVPDEVIPPGGKPKKVLVVDDTGDKPKVLGVIGKPLQTEQELKSRDFALATAFMAGTMGWGGGLEALAYGAKRYTPTEKKPTRCGLPGCDKTSTRDYCCPEHCREHRALQKANHKMLDI